MPAYILSWEEVGLYCDIFSFQNEEPEGKKRKIQLTLVLIELPCFMTV